MPCGSGHDPGPLAKCSPLLNPRCVDCKQPPVSPYSYSEAMESRLIGWPCNKPMPLPSIPTPLAILNLVFHINTSFLIHIFLRSVLWLLDTANIPSSPILITLIMEAICFSETSVLKDSHSATSQKMILHSHRCENLKSYTVKNLILGSLDDMSGA
jgi:hypothetical protein